MSNIKSLFVPLLADTGTDVAKSRQTDDDLTVTCTARVWALLLHTFTTAVEHKGVCELKWTLCRDWTPGQLVDECFLATSACQHHVGET